MVQGSNILSTFDLVLISQGAEYCTQNDALNDVISYYHLWGWGGGGGGGGGVTRLHRN